MTFSIDNPEGSCNNCPSENMFGKNPQDNKGYPEGFSSDNNQHWNGLRLPGLKKTLPTFSDMREYCFLYMSKGFTQLVEASTLHACFYHRTTLWSFGAYNSAFWYIKWLRCAVWSFLYLCYHLFIDNLHLFFGIFNVSLCIKFAVCSSAFFTHMVLCMFWYGHLSLSSLLFKGSFWLYF